MSAALVTLPLSFKGGRQLAKTNGKNGAPVEGGWRKALEEMEARLLLAIDARIDARLNERLSPIMVKLTVLDMKVDALDRRVTKLEKRQ